MRWSYLSILPSAFLILARRKAKKFRKKNLRHGRLEEIELKDDEMIGQILANRFEIDLDVDAKLLEMIFRTDATVHQDVGRIERSSGYYYFLLRTKGNQFHSVTICFDLALGFDRYSSILWRISELGIRKGLQNNTQDGRLEKNVEICGRIVVHEVGSINKSAAVRGNSPGSRRRRILAHLFEHLREQSLSHVPHPRPPLGQTYPVGKKIPDLCRNRG
jgi:hypothetical protein